MDIQAEKLKNTLNSNKKKHITHENKMLNIC